MGVSFSEEFYPGKTDRFNIAQTLPATQVCKLENPACREREVIRPYGPLSPKTARLRA